MNVLLHSLPVGSIFLLPDPEKKIKYIGKFKKLTSTYRTEIIHEDTNCIWLESYEGNRPFMLNNFPCYIPSNTLVNAQMTVRIRL